VLGVATDFSGRHWAQSFRLISSQLVRVHNSVTMAIAENDSLACVCERLADARYLASEGRRKRQRGRSRWFQCISFSQFEQRTLSWEHREGSAVIALGEEGFHFIRGLYRSIVCHRWLEKLAW